MPDRRPSRAARPSRWLAALLSTGMLAGCASSQGGEARIALPPRAAPGPAAQVQVARPSARQQVLAAYAGYWQALRQAEDARSAPQARTIMAPHEVARDISPFVALLGTQWARGDIAYGVPVSHILHVRLIGRTAVVDDCLDTTQSGLQHAGSGAVVAGTLGTGHDNLATTMVLQRGRWLMSIQTPVEEICGY